MTTTTTGAATQIEVGMTAALTLSTGVLTGTITEVWAEGTMFCWTGENGKQVDGVVSRKHENRLMVRNNRSLSFELVS
jgi:hypothetical protein